MALPISTGSATPANLDPVGRALLGPSGGSSVSGTAFLTRRLSTNETHVILRATGLPALRTLTWRVYTGAQCGVAGAKRLAPSGTFEATKLGLAMVSTTLPGAISASDAGPDAYITLRIFDQGIVGFEREIACGNFVDQPDTFSQHWW